MTQVMERNGMRTADALRDRGPSSDSSPKKRAPFVATSPNGSNSSKSGGGGEVRKLASVGSANGAPKTPAAETAAGRWTSATEEPALARVQQFIIDTLKNPMRFIVGDTPVVAQEVPYKPINDPEVLAERKEQRQSNGKANGATPPSLDKGKAAVRSDAEQSNAPVDPSSPQKLPDLFAYRLSLHPPRVAKEHGAGLNNRGNTCYMNSTLQALLHLPPLASALLMLDSDQLYGRFGAHPQHKFDAVQELATLAQRSLLKTSNANGTLTPLRFIQDLKSYARTLVKLRQEDAHEFLRFLQEAMQACCLLRAPKSLKPFDPLRETTLVHKVFGGKLRSRVTCGRCSHNSDTYDPVLDLSLDIRNLRSPTLNSAIEQFTSTDAISGREKYRCEKCKMPVNAMKRFTIHQAPVVLTIHLKRFTLTGQKISKAISFGEELTVGKNVLSEGQAPQRYRLHAIVHHQGGGPNSGHYVASVRGASGNRWYEMNDSSVRPLRSAPINAATAYILFYVRAPGSALEGIMQHPTPKKVISPSAVSTPVGKKRALDGSEDGDGPSGHRDKVFRPSSSGANGTPTKLPNGTLKGTPPIAKVDKSASIAFRGASQSKSFMSFDDDGDDDDLGEAVATTSSPKKPAGYESLVGSSTKGDFDGPRKPMTKKQRQRQRSASLGVRRGGGFGQNAEPRRHLVSSPYLASRGGGQNGNGGARFGQNGASIRGRMKDKHGRRAGDSFF